MLNSAVVSMFRISVLIKKPASVRIVCGGFSAERIFPWRVENIGASVDLLMVII